MTPMKSHPPGTRWAVRRIRSNERVVVYDPEIDPSRSPTSWPIRAEAIRVLWTMRGMNTSGVYRLVRIPPKHSGRTVEERIAEAVTAERADRDRGHMRQLQEFQEAARAREAEAVSEAVLNGRAMLRDAIINHEVELRRRDEAFVTAVRERTEMICNEWDATFMTQTRPKDQHFGSWLRNLRDGKVTP